MKTGIPAMALALAVVCLSFGTANAQEISPAKKAPAQQQAQKAKPDKEQMKKMMEKRMAEFNKAMGLTEEQIAKAKEIRKKGHEKMKPLMEKKAAKIAELRKVMENEEMTIKAQDKKVEELKKELFSIEQDIRQAIRDNEKEFKSILTDEQKLKYAEIKKQGREHFRNHHRPQGPENFKGGPIGHEHYQHKQPAPKN